jgi:malate dehydrogenase (oxaloacetate-decarboxylating)
MGEKLVDIRQESLKKHYEWQGKIEVIFRAPINTKEDLALAYTPVWQKFNFLFDKDKQVCYNRFNALNRKSKIAIQE